MSVADRLRQLRERLVPPTARALRTFWLGQAGRAVSRLTRPYKQGPRDPEALLPPEEDAMLELVLRPFLEAGILQAAEIAAAMMALPAPDPTDTRIVDQLARAATRVRGINEATREAIREVLQEATVRGYGLFDLVNGVERDGFRGLRAVIEETYRGRAETVARTELGEASLRAAHTEWERAGVQYVRIIDGVLDEPCASRNGTVVPLTEAPGLAHPNCTVVTVPVTAYG
ncbi:MAG TPA: hypothetical protein VNN07_06475 [Candidatus Tectomicrobia bacterium]|nr:hypothetical protein [Candidatus Tectomicrobia bacterium]